MRNPDGIKLSVTLLTRLTKRTFFDNMFEVNTFGVLEDQERTSIRKYIHGNIKADQALAYGQPVNEEKRKFLRFLLTKVIPKIPKPCLKPTLP